MVSNAYDTVVLKEDYINNLNKHTNKYFDIFCDSNKFTYYHYNNVMFEETIIG